MAKKRPEVPDACICHETIHTLMPPECPVHGKHPAVAEIISMDPCPSCGGEMFSNDGRIRFVQCEDCGYKIQL